MNSEETMNKLRDRDGRVTRLAQSDKDNQQIIDTLYLAALCRYPTAEESRLVSQAFSDAKGHVRDRRLATEDILWALINTREFVHNH